MGIRMSVRALLIACVIAPAHGQALSARSDGESAREAPERLITISFHGLSAREAFAFLGTRTRHVLRPIWSDAGAGLDPDARIELTLAHAPLTDAIEALVRQCDTGAGGGATWQFAADGALEAGPRLRLNEHPVTKIYDVRDLLAIVPDFREGATLDLQAALQARAGSSVLRDPERGSDPQPRPDRAQDLVDLITQTVEPDQWWIAGGAATIRMYNGQLVVRAAPYIQRQIAGHTKSLQPPD